MTRAEKRAAVLRAITAHPTASNREIGRIIGVDGKTVTALRNSVIPHSAEIHQPAEIQIPHPEPETPQCGNSNSAAASEPYSAEFETPQPAENEKISQIPHFTTPLDAIAAQIPPERWPDIGYALVKFHPLPTTVEAIVAGLPADERAALGWQLMARPKPKKERARTGRPPFRHGEEKQRDAVEMWKRGVSCAKIGELLGMSAVSAKGLVYRTEKPRQKGRQSAPGTNGRLKYTDEQRDDVIRLRQTGLLYREIGERLGITTGGVKTIAAAAGLARRRL